MRFRRIMDFVSQRNIINAGCIDFCRSINICESALRAFGSGDVIYPEKMSVVFDEKSQNRINCLPAGFWSTKIYGMKWVSVFPGNPVGQGLPNVNAVILLSEMNTGQPLAFLEGTICSNIRTASMSALAAKYLAPSNPRKIGFIGAGEQAKTHFAAMKTVFPSIVECRVSSRTQNTADTFIQQMAKRYNDTKFVSCGNKYCAAVEGVDIIVTAISGQAKILQAEWIGKGVLYCHVGGLEDDFAVPQKADKIVCDDWQAVKHRTQTISQMFHLGLLSDSNIYANLFEIIMGMKKGRENNEEFIYYNGVGLSYVDVAIGAWAYKCCKAKGEYVELELSDGDMFETNPPFLSST